MDSKIAPLIVIVGATASGKSQLGLNLAEQFNGEIISADSWTVYKGFDIGTAKPSPEEQRLIPHHLIDVTTPQQGFSAAVFKRLAMIAINDITSRGKLPILVGGTGLYIDSVLFDYSFLSPHNTTNRDKLNNLSLFELLEKVNKMGLDASYIDKSNKRRIIRLIENNGEIPTKKTLRPNTLVIGLRLDKTKLAARIQTRVEKMVKMGLEGEVREQYQLYGWDVEPMKGIGYKEWRPFFDKTSNIEQTKESIRLATKKLVKKQETWFKRNKSIHWVETKIQAVELVTTFLGK